MSVIFVRELSVKFVSMCIDTAHVKFAGSECTVLLGWHMAGHATASGMYSDLVLPNLKSYHHIIVSSFKNKMCSNLMESL